MHNSPVSTAILIVEIIFTALIFYQIFYTIVSLVKRLPKFKAKSVSSFAVLISARNEEKVIGNLIRSIMAQDYPRDHFHVFVVADNCTDNTAEMAKAAGATVYERYSKKKKGKGYALNFLIKSVFKDYGTDAFDGYLVFDADNLLDGNYLKEINKVFTNGYRIVTSYRNSKNFGSNWISACSSLWFIRESRNLNRARMCLGNSCMVSGTGFLVHKDILKKTKGWKYYLLTEDMQFSVDNIVKDEIIGYCEDAVFYDEQPLRFIDSWNQRIRWAKGFYQVLYKFGGRLFGKLVKTRKFTFFDVIMTISTGHLFFGMIVIIGLLSAINSGFDINLMTAEVIPQIFSGLIITYCLFLFFGLAAVIPERNRIKCSFAVQIKYVFMFPVFFMTYVPLCIIALFVPVKWKAVKHVVDIDINKLEDK